MNLSKTKMRALDTFKIEGFLRIFTQKNKIRLMWNSFCFKVNYNVWHDSSFCCFLSMKISHILQTFYFKNRPLSLFAFFFSFLHFYTPKYLQNFTAVLSFLSETLVNNQCGASFEETKNFCNKKYYTVTKKRLTSKM